MFPSCWNSQNTIWMASLLLQILSEYIVVPLKGPTEIIFMLTISSYPEYNQLGLSEWSAFVFLDHHYLKPYNKSIVTTNNVRMSLSILNFMMN